MCLYRVDTVILLGAFGAGTGVAGIGFGVAELLVSGEGGACVRRDRFPPIKTLTDKFLVFTHCLLRFWLMDTDFSSH